MSLILPPLCVWVALPHLVLILVFIVELALIDLVRGVLTLSLDIFPLALFTVVTVIILWLCLLSLFFLVLFLVVASLIEGDFSVAVRVADWNSLGVEVSVRVSQVIPDLTELLSSSHWQLQDVLASAKGSQILTYRLSVILLLVGWCLQVTTILTYETV